MPTSSLQNQMLYNQLYNNGQTKTSAKKEETKRPKNLDELYINGIDKYTADDAKFVERAESVKTWRKWEDNRESLQKYLDDNNMNMDAYSLKRSDMLKLAQADTKSRIAAISGGDIDTDLSGIGSQEGQGQGAGYFQLKDPTGNVIDKRYLVGKDIYKPQDLNPEMQQSLEDPIALGQIARQPSPEQMQQQQPETESGMYDVNGKQIYAEGRKARALKARGFKLASPNGGENGSDYKQIAQDIMYGNSALDLSTLPIKDRASVAKELNVMKKEAEKNGDMVGLMRATAGGTKASDSFRQSISKATTVLDQIETLNGLFAQDTDNIISGLKEITGFDASPFLGWIREINPYDYKAQEINTVLTSVVPNLARGVFGEVGVLTDNDIKLYKKVLPNLRTPEELRKAILGLTVKAAYNGINRRLKLEAGLGTDLSGLAQTGFYQEFENIVKKLDPESINKVSEENTDMSGLNSDEWELVQ